MFIDTVQRFESQGLVYGLAALLLVGCRPTERGSPAAMRLPDRPRDAPGAIRMGTYNAKFLPEVLPDRARARRLARRLLQGDYDVMVLNEIFDERVRRTFVQELTTRFPYHVAYLGSTRRLRQDSGLMLFSRYPFLPLLPEVTHRARNALASNDGGFTDWPDVGFIEFSACDGSDCFAAKGVGYVRILVDDRPLNVFFTHLQASYARDDDDDRAVKVAIRRAQLGDLQALVADVLGAERRQTENVVILGDLNVEGAVTRPPGSFRLLGHRDEWQHFMTSLNSELLPNLIDVWYEYAPKHAHGLTFPASDPQNRFDYILLSTADPGGPLCVRDVRLDDNLRTDSRGHRNDFSDHLGVTAVFQRQGCPARVVD